MRGPPSILCIVLAACTSAQPVDGTRGALVHGDGVLDAASDDFHGRILERSGWDFPLCQKCHGADFGGGVSGVTCLSCHVEGPTSCATCHGASPASGAHPIHVLGGTLLGRKLACSECHVQPKAWDDPGHLRDAEGRAITAPPTVRFGELASRPAPARTGPPTYDAGRCDNVYCHGTAASPSWSGVEKSTCASCHGQPPISHPIGACATCHGAVIDAQGKLVGPARHLDGLTTLGNGDGTCLACHPTLGGAHTSHLAGTNKLATPIACTECHVVPAATSSLGHFTSDGLAAVFPIGGTGPLANADGATPRFVSATMSCSSTYCHGGGALLMGDASLGVIREPLWKTGSGAGRCGTCHGLPPLDGVHDPAWQITQCSLCHGKSVGPSGLILFTNGTSTHMNGIVDAP